MLLPGASGKRGSTVQALSIALVRGYKGNGESKRHLRLTCRGLSRATRAMLTARGKCGSPVEIGPDPGKAAALEAAPFV